MKEEIQKLLDQDNLVEALQLLRELDDEAILLLSQYNSANRDFMKGLLGENEFSRMKKRIQFGIELKLEQIK